MFTEFGFATDTFDVLPRQRPGDFAVDPVIEVEFPDPSGYDVIVPLGARWSAYDDRLPWIEAEMDLVRRDEFDVLKDEIAALRAEIAELKAQKSPAKKASAGTSTAAKPDADTAG